VGKNKGKGGKNRRKGKNESDEKKDLVLKQFGQEYAQVLRMLGNGRLEAHCFDGKKRLCHIPGKMRRRVWVNQGDVLLVGLREFQDDKADIMKKYNSEEARKLKKMGELPADWKVEDEGDREKIEDIGFDFTGAEVKESDDEEEVVQNQPNRYGPLPEYEEEESEEEIEVDYKKYSKKEEINELDEWAYPNFDFYVAVVLADQAEIKLHSIDFY